MPLHLPLGRGRFCALPTLRDGLLPRDLLGGDTDLHLPVDETGGIRIERVSTFIVGRRGGIALADDDGNAAELLRIEADEAERLIDAGADLYFIGATDGGTAHLALVVDESEHQRIWGHLRRCGHLLGADEAALATAAVALASWHASFRYCPRCASPVDTILSGWATSCTGCGALEYPRQDPAVITLIEDEDGRVLFAHNRNWDDPLYSLIAGFVEAGETPEAAAVREAMEEVGLAIVEPTYVATQPWPFPRSQMMGFTARPAPGQAPTPRPDGVEIDDARFCSREDYRREVEVGRMRPPGPTSIARALIERWYGAPLPTGSTAADALRGPQ